MMLGRRDHYLADLEAEETIAQRAGEIVGLHAPGRDDGHEAETEQKQFHDAGQENPELDDALAARAEARDERAPEPRRGLERLLDRFGQQRRENEQSRGDAGDPDELIDQERGEGDVAEERSAGDGDDRRPRREARDASPARRRRDARTEAFLFVVFVFAQPEDRGGDDDGEYERAEPLHGRGEGERRADDLVERIGRLADRDDHGDRDGEPRQPLGGVIRHGDQAPIRARRREQAAREPRRQRDADDGFDQRALQRRQPRANQIERVGQREQQEDRDDRRDRRDDRDPARAERLPEPVGLVDVGSRARMRRTCR